MYAGLITILFSFLLIFIIFKIIYLEKNPLTLGLFWLIQLDVIFLGFLVIFEGKFLILTPFVVSFSIVFILFKIFNKQKDPFKMIWFWVVQIIVVLVVSTMVLYIVLIALGGKPREEDKDNLYEHLNVENISSVVLIQGGDTVQIKDHETQWFVLQLSNAREAIGPVKFANKGKIIFTRTDESKDSLNTNGYGYGPYKGKWYQSEGNVLEDFFNR